MSVYNPYHFVPVFERNEGQRADDVALDDLPLSDRLTHASYASETYSGEVTCQLTAETPFFIGSSRDGAPIIKGFEIGGRPAIPASSLRGMISHVAEAASESALRVLGRETNGEACYSFRRAADQALSAIGRLRKASEGWRLEPITLPQLPCSDGMTIKVDRENERWRGVFPKPALRVYINPGQLRTWNGNTDGFLHLALAPVAWADATKSTIQMPAGSLKIKERQVISQNPTVAGPPDRVGQPGWTRGVVRVLGFGRGVVATKHWEMFLPYEPDDAGTTWIEIPDAVMRKFQMLANQRTDATKDRPREPILPLEPLDTRPGRGRTKLEPKDGDLVYFNVNTDGSEVNEISYSAIWRDRVETLQNSAANAWHFFAGVDADLPPFHDEIDGLNARQKLTITEQMFGFVEERVRRGTAGTSIEEGSARALKGRLRFSDGMPDGDCQFGDQVPVRVLNGPKPPSPAMYFKTRDPREDGFVTKSELRPGRYWPQGRKFYLHHPGANDRFPWAHEEERDGSFDANMQVKIRPIPAKSTFTFRIRFDNLSRKEMGLLLYSLRPTPEFRHKLGMGKAIGLGTVDIEPAELRIVNRATRYSADGWMSPRDRDASGEIAGLASEWRDGMREETRRSLEVLGDPAKVRSEFSVQTPVTRTQAANGSRTETYKWFVANERGGGKNLKALERNDFEIAPLDDL